MFPNVRRNIVGGVNRRAVRGGDCHSHWPRGRSRELSASRPEGAGLLLASGNSIGQNANQISARAHRLSCGAAASFVEHSTLIDVLLLEPKTAISVLTTALSPVPVDLPQPRRTR